MLRRGVSGCPGQLSHGGMWTETGKRAGTGWQREKAEVGRALGLGGVFSLMAQGVTEEQLQEKKEVLGGLALSFSPMPGLQRQHPWGRSMSREASHSWHVLARSGSRVQTREREG